MLLCSHLEMEEQAGAAAWQELEAVEEALKNLLLNTGKRGQGSSHECMLSIKN